MVDLNFKSGDYIKFTIFGDLIIGRITDINHRLSSKDDTNCWNYVILYRDRSHKYSHISYPNRYPYQLSRTFAIKYQVTVITKEEAFMEMI